MVGGSEFVKWYVDPYLKYHIKFQADVSYGYQQKILGTDGRADKGKPVQ